MKEKEEIEIDLGKLLHAYLRKWWLILSMMVVFGAAALGFTYHHIQPTYTSRIKIYVNNSQIDVGNLSISTSDMNASIQLVDVYRVILNTKDTLDLVIEKTGLPYSYEQVLSMLSTASVNGTQIFQVAVTNTSPEEAQLIATTIGEVLPGVIGSIIDSADARIVEHAIVPRYRSGPDYTRNTLICAMVGAVLTVGIITLFELLDITIKDEEDLTEVIERIPILTNVSKFAESAKNNTMFLCENMNYQMSESYKMLKIKIRLLFTQNLVEKEKKKSRKCKTIGITSALSGEGKTTTAINYAYSLAESGFDVCLIEGDMRLPSVCKKISLKNTPGLSNVLCGQEALSEALQTYGSHDKKVEFHVLTAGDIPPTPSELLGSQNMKTVIKQLSEEFDYLIVDLPPAVSLSDTLSISGFLDGILLIVRQNYGDKKSLKEMLEQLRMSNTKILGVVFNCFELSAGHSFYYYRSNKYYYKKYYGKYYGKSKSSEEKKSMEEAQ